MIFQLRMKVKAIEACLSRPPSAILAQIMALPPITPELASQMVDKVGSDPSLEL